MPVMDPVVTDISHHNNVISFSSIKTAGIVGIIHKASQGTSFVDKMYDQRMPKALNAGLLWGAYHFATDAPVKKQVDFFLKSAQPTEKTLLALDYEPNPQGGTMDLDQAREWCQLVFEKTGQKPVIYSGHLIKQDLGNDEDDFLGSHRLWLAQYGPKAKVPAAWKDYWLWQYTGDGIGPKPHGVDGMSGDQLDLNVFNGKRETLIKQWSKS